MPKVLMPIGDATEVLDTMYPYFRLPEDGFEVVVAGPEARLYHMVQHEIPPGWDITQETAGYHLQATAAFRDLDGGEFAGLFLSGGRAPEYLRYNTDLIRLVKHFFEHSKPVAAICHGMHVLPCPDSIRCRRIPPVSKATLNAAPRCATYLDEPVVIDGNLVTSRVWQDNTHFVKAFIDLLHTSAS